MTENAAIPALTDEEVKQKTEDILEALRDVVDPELGINVVDLGLIYGIHVDDENVATVDMTLTSAACPLRSLWLRLRSSREARRASPSSSSFMLLPRK